MKKSSGHTHKHKIIQKFRVNLAFVKEGKVGTLHRRALRGPYFTSAQRGHSKSGYHKTLLSSVASLPLTRALGDI